MTTAPWPDSRLADLLGVTHPIVQAPMKGTSGAALAAAVSDAGALGSFPCGGLDPDEVRDALLEMRRLTNHAFSLNFFANPASVADPEAVARARDRLAPIYAALGLGPPPDRIDPAPAGFTADHLAVLVADPPPVVSFHFGLPPPEAVAQLKAAGARVISSATTVAEAQSLVQSGVDAVIAQGAEAGGHRGAFTQEGIDAAVGLVALVPQVADAVPVPVIAAGGIADGRAIAAAFALGASGVQIGTAFAATPESATDPLHRAAIAGASDVSTCLTRAATGRPARAQRTRFFDAMADATDLPAFPLMLALTGPLRATGDPDFQFLLYGQAAPLTRQRPAAELVAALVAETADAFARCRPQA